MYRTVDRHNARIVTAGYRAYGTIYLGPDQSVAELLNTVSRHLLPVTEPLIYAAGTDHPPAQSDLMVSAGFLALHYDQIAWIVGGRAPSGEGSRRAMAFLFDGYVLMGRVEVEEGVRSSDFLETAAGFQTLFDAEIYPWEAPEGRFLLIGRDMNSLFEVGALQEGDGRVVNLEALERFPFVTLNLRRALGVLEAPGSGVGASRAGVLN
jgi:hypothetical protein